MHHNFPRQQPQQQIYNFKNTSIRFSIPLRSLISTSYTSKVAYTTSQSLVPSAHSMPQRSIFSYVSPLPNSLSSSWHGFIHLIAHIANQLGTYRRQRNPLLLAAFIGGGGIYLGLKWRAVLQASEAAKKAGTKDINYSVAPGRSGKLICMLCWCSADVCVGGGI